MGADYCCFEFYYGNDGKRELTEEVVSVLREKWGSLSEFVKEIKQGFSRFYNKRHGRKGFSGLSDLPG